MTSLLREFQIYHLKSIWGGKLHMQDIKQITFSTEILTHNLLNFVLCLPFLQRQPLKVPTSRFLLGASGIFYTVHIAKLSSPLQMRKEKRLTKVQPSQKEKLHHGPMSPFGLHPTILDPGTPGLYHIKHSSQRDSSSCKHCTNSPAFSLST